MHMTLNVCTEICTYQIKLFCSKLCLIDMLFIVFIYYGQGFAKSMKIIFYNIIIAIFLPLNNLLNIKITYYCIFVQSISVLTKINILKPG
jgi:hypothetical protein